jgi:hypothetical protein
MLPHLSLFILTASTEDWKLRSWMLLLAAVFITVSLRGVSAGCSPAGTCQWYFSRIVVHVMCGHVAVVHENVQEAGLGPAVWCVPAPTYATRLVQNSISEMLHEENKAASESRGGMRSKSGCRQLRCCMGNYEGSAVCT